MRNSGIVAFPTETVYGLGVAVFNEEAVAKVFEAKRRPHFDSLIVHVSGPAQLPLLTDEIPPPPVLIDQFWLGPLTMVLPKAPRVPDLVTALLFICSLGGGFGIILAMRLTIIVPAHNEETRIGKMLDAYLPYFSSRYGAEGEIVVVINGSTDGTERVVSAYQQQYPMLRVVVEPMAIGKGGAVMLGFREARGELVGFVDADGATPPEAFQDLVEHIGNAGGIIASRWCDGAQVSPRQPLDRRVASRIFNWITRMLFGLKLTDTQCGAKLMRRDAVLKVLPKLGITQWAFDVDLLFQLRRAGERILEIPTVWRDVEGSKVQVVRASTEMLLALIRLRIMHSPFHGMVHIYDRTLGRVFNPAGLERDHLLFHSLVLMIGAQIGNVCNLLFQLVMVRMLSDADYGVMAAMLGLMMGVSMPLGALSGTATHFVARFMQAKRPDLARVLMGKMMKGLAAPAALLFLAVLIGRQNLGSYFNLTSLGPIYVVAATLVVGVYSAVPNGVLTGVQAFGWATAIGNGGNVLRLLLGTGVVMMGAGAVGVLSVHGFCIFAGAVTGLILCGHAIKQAILARGVEVPSNRTEADGVVGWRHALKYMGGYMAAFAGFAVLSNADLVLVKHYFDATQAGLFAKAAMVARIVFFLPQPIAAALFPKVASGGEASYANGRTLLKGVMLMLIIVAITGGFFMIFPGFMLRLLAGTADPGLIPVVRGMVLALTPLALLSALLTYEVAQHRFIVALPLGVCAAGYVLAAERWHETPLQIVMALGVSGLVALVAVIALLPWGQMRNNGEKKTFPE